MEADERLGMCNAAQVYGTFTAADALRVFGPSFLDGEVCNEWVLSRLHPNGPRCPQCGSNLSPKAHGRLRAGGRVKCRACRKRFTAYTKTFLSGSQMGPREIVLLAVFMAVGLPSKSIAAIIHRTPETVRLWRRRLEGCDLLGQTGLLQAELNLGLETLKKLTEDVAPAEPLPFGKTAPAKPPVKR